MKIAITGSSGSLAAGVISVALSDTPHTLLLIDRRPPEKKLDGPRVEYITADLLDYSAFLTALKGADGLIHLAGYAQPYHGHPTLIHNTNVSLSYNALNAAVEVGVKHVVLASSVNAIGGFYSSTRPTLQYLPVDELHPTLNEECYSLSKYMVEVQGASVARSNPDMSISSLRFHHVVPEKKKQGDDVAGNSQDLWGYVLSSAAGRACLLAMEVDWTGHEVMYIVGEEHCADGHDASALAKAHYPEAEIREGLKGPSAFYSCAKAGRMLGWKHSGGRQLMENRTFVAAKPEDVEAPHGEPDASSTRPPGRCVIF
ncbi:hypothetical protein BOTBODRAFT_162803 [Botryobasidium botryosum FD-172 SS1]|uniref:NAD-dependent epimerase/dehydratase domain-containing protein n=1 Tax=Botryobasidium botryosum (strain FD-172 SS1) TaxID=930990 RepID=A0A067M6T3_BOTB1|nr:hypothetical protein BOTBODRAFT_162803 [Botryobasidium botryosum FD-172 SS1]